MASQRAAHGRVLDFLLVGETIWQETGLGFSSVEFQSNQYLGYLGYDFFVKKKKKKLVSLLLLLMI